jgi:hypothetical protein
LHRLPQKYVVNFKNNRRREKKKANLSKLEENGKIYVVNLHIDTFVESEVYFR